MTALGHLCPSHVGAWCCGGALLAMILDPPAFPLHPSTNLCAHPSLSTSCSKTQPQCGQFNFQRKTNKCKRMRNRGSTAKEKTYLHADLHPPWRRNKPVLEGKVKISVRWPMARSAAAKSLQSCPTLCDPIDGSSPGSTIPGILQARTLEWVAISFSNA